MSFYLKDPEAVLDYVIDWAADYLGTDSISQSDWTIEPAEPGGIQVVGSQHDMATTTVQAGGGLAGHVYRLTNHVVLASGREDRRTIILRVEHR